MKRISGNVLIIGEQVASAHIWRYALNQRGIDTTLLVSSSEDDTEQRIEHIHDLIIIDICSPNVDVTKLIRHLRNETPAPIMFLLPVYDESVIVEIYEMGVDDVSIKPLSPVIFQAKVAALIRRSSMVPSSLLDSFVVGNLRLDPAQRQLIIDTNVIRLTTLEFRMMHLLMSHPGQVMESSLIINRVWGSVGVGEGDNVLLKNVVYRLRRKIEPDPGNPRYIQSVKGEGYIFLPTPCA